MGTEGSDEGPSMQVCMTFASNPYDKYQKLICCLVDDRLRFKLVNGQLVAADYSRLIKCSKLITVSVIFKKKIKLV